MSSAIREPPSYNCLGTVGHQGSPCGASAIWRYGARLDFLGKAVSFFLAGFVPASCHNTQRRRAARLPARHTGRTPPRRGAPCPSAAGARRRSAQALWCRRQRARLRASGTRSLDLSPSSLPPSSTGSGRRLGHDATQRATKGAWSASDPSASPYQRWHRSGPRVGDPLVAAPSSS